MSNKLIPQIDSYNLPKTILTDLQSPETKIKIKAIQSLHQIMIKIGTERTRSELLPYIINCIDEEDDDSGIELAKILPNILEYSGGAKYGTSMLPIYEILLHSDDTNLRKETMTSLHCGIEELASFNDIESDGLSLARRLMQSEETAYKIGCIEGYSIIFLKTTKENVRSDIDAIFRKYLTEENASQGIKIELATSLHMIGKVVSVALYEDLINHFISEENDSIRIQIVDGGMALKSSANLSKYHAFLAEVIKKLGNDASWRVRFTLSEKVDDGLTFPVIDMNMKNAIINVYCKLLIDPEAEVRSSACGKLELMADVLEKDPIFDKVLAQLVNLEKDKVNYVRAALASNLLRICPLIGAAKTTEYIFPIFLNMIKDEEHDIRMTLIKSLDRLHEAVSIDGFIQGIIPSIIEISNNKSWRIRNQIAETVPVLARILSKKIFMDNVLNICIKWLTDPVYKIRESACKLMKKGYDIFKGEDFEKRGLEKLNEIKQNDNYLIRNTITLLIKEFANDIFNYDFVERKGLPFAIRLSKDRISNIRMNSVHILRKISKVSKSNGVLKEIQNAFDDLKRDKDIEVGNALNDN